MDGNNHRALFHQLQRAFLIVLPLLAVAGPVYAQEAFNTPENLELTRPPQDLLGSWVRPEGLAASLQILMALTILTLLPAIILMTTSFVRVLVVLAILRQAVGTHQLPPSQVITALAFFVTVAVMTPVWHETYREAIRPYTERKITLEKAWENGTAPIRRFMSLQIERAGNAEDVWLFLRYVNPDISPTTYDEVPLQALIPAFMLSELKTAFLIGFQIYVPFLIIDMVTAAVLLSLGMFMVPPAILSLPFKLALFVLLDGWHLVVGMLLESFAPFA